jgi:hypothetical protein
MQLIRRVLVASLAPAIAALSFAATAQTPPAASAPATAPKHSCVKPGEHPGRLASDNQQRSWTRSVNAYLECLKKFVTEQQAAAKPYQDAAQVYIQAGNAAIEEFNNSVKEFKDQQDKAAPN